MRKKSKGDKWKVALRVDEGGIFINVKLYKQN